MRFVSGTRRLFVLAGIWLAVVVTWELFLLEIEATLSLLGALASLVLYAGVTPLVLLPLHSPILIAQSHSCS